jgi:hypothetical protein
MVEGNGFEIKKEKFEMFWAEKDSLPPKAYKWQDTE